MNELLNTVPFPVIIVIGILIVASLVVMGYSYLKEKTLDSIRADVYQLFVKAENAFRASPAGKQKMKWVMSQARLLLPKWLQALISEEALAVIVETWFREVKDLLDDGRVNGSQNKNK